MKFTRILLASCSSLLLLGCLPLPKKTPAMAESLPLVIEGNPQEAQRLVVMLPGYGDRVGHFEDHQFLQLAAASQGDDVAFVATDSHFGYYRNFDLPNYFQHDILDRWPDAKITLVGISMGGFGALSLARLFPERVDDVVLMAPYLGSPYFLRRRVANDRLEVRANDGPRKLMLLENWQFLEDNPYDQTYSLLVGRFDPLALTLHLVRNKAPDVAITKGRGGHNWKAWRRLWEAHLEETCW